MKKIILATTSPYRIEAVKMLGVDFESCGSEVDEDFSGRPDDPKGLVGELAKRKARAVSEKYKSGIVIGFDSVGFFGGKILEKPKSREEAKKRLLAMSGKNFDFYTGICTVDASSKKTREYICETKVQMRELFDFEIEAYLDEDPKFKTYALGFDPLGHRSAGFVKNISGSYNNLLRGIPLELIAEIVNDFRKNEN